MPFCSLQAVFHETPRKPCTDSSPIRSRCNEPTPNEGAAEAARLLEIAAQARKVYTPPRITPVERKGSKVPDGAINLELNQARERLTTLRKGFEASDPDAVTANRRDLLALIDAVEAIVEEIEDKVPSLRYVDELIKD